MTATPKGKAKRQQSQHDTSLAALAAQRRDQFLEAVATSAGMLLRSPAPMAALPGVIERIGSAVSVDRVHVLEVEAEDAAGCRPVIRHCVWSAPELDPPTAQDAAPAPIAAPEPDGWIARLARGEVLAGAVRQLDPGARAFFDDGWVKSVLVVPIFVDDRWWGMAEFADSWGERDWLAGEIAVARILAELVGATVARAHTLEAAAVVSEPRRVTRSRQASARAAPWPAIGQRGR
jgi:GAF domain-containing protein